MKRFIKRVLYYLVQLTKQYERESIYRNFNIQSSVSFNELSIDGNVTIGEHTYLNDYTRVDSGPQSKISIGKYCAIGRYVHITSKTHDLTQPTQDTLNPAPKIREADVIIGDHVWIGDKVTILPGVTIGDHAVIAAHAVVTKTVKAFEIVGGVPAKHIRFNTMHNQYKGK